MDNIKDYFRADEIIDVKSSTSTTIIYINDPRKKVELPQVTAEFEANSDIQVLRSEIFLP